ncbi:rhodanese-like domain-containing protein [Candidatus Bathyarchaeota archaeon]|nr:rhodanese-like domain-containing protein [Candidatus Bathyarchaeota archaeon]
MPRIKFITIETLLEMMENKDEFKLIEALSEGAYNQGHIPGAINIPPSRIELEAEQSLNKNDKIVVYCASYICESSTKATEKLLEMGYENTVDFKAGKLGWRRAGFNLERTV